MESSTGSPLTVRSEEPYNAETRLDVLRASWETPVESFFVRCHGTIPRIDRGLYRLSLTGLVEREVHLTFEDLVNRFPRRDTTATLQCAGNRRSDLAVVEPIPGEILWGAGAIGNSRWTGAQLCELLRAAGPLPEASHVELIGLDECKPDGESTPFGASIPIEQALHPDTLIAYRMNGQLLDPNHGAPARAVVPGYIGARSVKWLGAIRVLAEPSPNYYQAEAYRLAGKEDGAPEPLGAMPLNSAICIPADGAAVEEGPVRFEGYAVTGAGRHIVIVELSPDAGATWFAAHLSPKSMPDRWTFWRAELMLSTGEHSVLVRARDSGGDAQPESARSVWNPKGYLSRAWHQIRVRVIPGDPSRPQPPPGRKPFGSRT